MQCALEVKGADAEGPLWNFPLVPYMHIAYWNLPITMVGIMSLEKRRYKRLPTNLLGRILPRRGGEATVRSAKAAIKNISLGGVFIESKNPYPLDTLVDLTFAIPGYADEVNAKGIVRWAQGDGPMIGMGIEFIEVSVPSRQAIQGYVGDRILTEGMGAVTKTELHRGFLALYARKLGETYSVEVLSSFLSCTHAQLLDVLRDFQAQDLVHSQGTDVTFLPATDEKLRGAIQVWLAKQGK